MASDEEAGYTRDETVAAQLDRNYAELLQELRVAQTGVQILFAFLLTLPFQQRFSSLSDVQLGIYLATLISAVTSAVLLVAPAAAHRLMFRVRLKDELVLFTSRVAAAGLSFLIIAVLGAILLVISVVSNFDAAGIVTGVIAALVLVVWAVLPARVRLAAGNRRDRGQ
jgi:hypothetical protein